MPINRKIVTLIALLLVILGAAFWYDRAHAPVDEFAIPAVADYKDGTYGIDRLKVTLANGQAESPLAPGSASMLVTKYFGNEAFGDLNGDGTPDAAFLLTQTGGGSGTFFYIVAALKTPAGYVGTNGILLGDRIAPQTTEIKDGEVVVNYADRRPMDPMTASPSVGLSRYFKIQNGALVETGGKTALFTCNNSKTIEATFYPADTHVDLSLSDGRKLSIPHAISASGARYANTDESFVFWNKGDTAFITESGTTTFADCATR